MAGKKIRLLVVDDFATMRNVIARLVSGEADIEVAAEANNGIEAVEKACQLHPDVVLMDMRMPVMDGLSALKEIMHRCPRPVLMVSAFACEGAEETLEALEAGAVDFVPKLDAQGSMNLEQFRRLLVDKIRAAAGARLPVAPPIRSPSRAKARPRRERRAIDIVLIGSSTGGPNALQTVLARLPVDLPAGVLIVQHMPAAFTAQLAARLDRMSALSVREAAEGDRVQAGEVLLAPGGRHLVLRQEGCVGLDEEPADALHRPSVDMLLHSGAEVYGPRALGVILTGMGEDGARGAAALKERGGLLIAQDEATSVVYGMPHAVAPLADEVCPLPDIAAAILARL